MVMVVLHFFFCLLLLHILNFNFSWDFVPIGCLVNSYVVNHVLLREMGGAIRVARPLTSDSQVKDHVEFLIEGPVTTWLALLDRFIYLTIIVEINTIRMPIGGICMETIVKALCIVMSFMRVKAFSMERGMNVIRILANPFHNINFTASWPSNLVNIISKHPESRPDTFSMRKLCPHFNFTIHPRVFSLCLEATRSVLTTSIIFFQGLKD